MSWINEIRQKHRIKELKAIVEKQEREITNLKAYTDWLLETITAMKER